MKDKKWQSHNMRVSRITHLKDEGTPYDQIMLISGHKSLDSLMKYMKNDEKKMVEKQHELFKKRDEQGENLEKEQVQMVTRKRDVKRKTKQGQQKTVKAHKE